MSAAGYCYDNTTAESFFATLKAEAFPPGAVFASKIEARRAIFDYLETFYNRRRRHSSLAYQSPEAVLKKHFQNHPTHLN
ncbi:MAG: transposase [Akkermansiaceae bacterium]|nr:transposase [Akkermansiaceae bacterium]